MFIPGPLGHIRSCLFFFFTLLQTKNSLWNFTFTCCWFYFLCFILHFSFQRFIFVDTFEFFSFSLCRTWIFKCGFSSICLLRGFCQNSWAAVFYEDVNGQRSSVYHQSLPAIVFDWCCNFKAKCFHLTQWFMKTHLCKSFSFNTRGLQLLGNCKQY